MSKIQISERLTTPSTGFIRVATLEELKAAGMLVVRGARCPLLVVYDHGKVFALDNRCPHLGFPLHRGSVEDGILTCHWHHARFDLASGCTFDLWADDVPTAAVEIRDGVVWACPHTRYSDGDAHWRNRLREGLEQNIGLVLAKAVLGLIGEGLDHRSLVRDAMLFGAHNRDGWGIGLTILTALAKLIPSLPEEETYHALYKGMSRVARDCDGASARRDRQPLAPREYQPLPVLGRWFRYWTRVRHRDAAERTLLTAIASGASSIELAALMLISVTDRYFADGGHVLDFTNKAFESLDIIGWEHVPAILPSVVDQIVNARGSEESNAWRQPIDLVPLCEAAFAELPELLAEGKTKRGSWRGYEPLALLLLGDDPTAVVAALTSAIRDGATATDLSRAVAYAAAQRIALFGTANEHSDWDTALHCFTYCNAVHQLLTRITAEGPMELERPELLRGVVHGAMQVYLIRFLNVPPARLPGEVDNGLDDLPRDQGELRDAFLAALDRQGAVKTAGRFVARYLSLGHAAEPLIATLARAVLREDADFHTYQMLEAGVQQYREWDQCPAGTRILIAVARYVAAHSPTERAQLQTAMVARRLSRGEAIHEAETSFDPLS
ncbi:MAG: Rieske (2Fe-2S) protein [Methyloceanibacter sp.]|uniref:Rieske (2Fe-2S) protein n=1 Tax=Methyloceanibacter sp. TaxID=1965321 RepID=UPI003D6D1FAD